MVRIVSLLLGLTLSAPLAAADLDVARSAYARGDAQRLERLRAEAQAERHPLLAWFEYWALAARLDEASADEVAAFEARWKGSFFEDRLRNDWLRVLGRRGEWAALAREYPRFVMNDDREVSCWAALAEHELRQGQRLRAAGLAAWQGQREADSGCQQMARTALAAGWLTQDAVWRRLRDATELGQQGAARAAAQLLGEAQGQALMALWSAPARYLNRPDAPARWLAVAVARLAADDPDAAAAHLRLHWDSALDTSNPEARGWRAWALAQVARQGAIKLHPQSLNWARAAWEAQDAKGVTTLAWSDDTLAWLTRAALRLGGEARWPLVARSIQAMEPVSQADPTWRYWLARAQLADADAAELVRSVARGQMAALATETHFYGQLAAEFLGAPQPLAPTPRPLSAAERRVAEAHPGLARALTAIAMGYRSEGNREWNYTLIGMTERELLAAADLACRREVWDRCIQTSERTKGEVDQAQRFPMPHRAEVLRHALAGEVDAALVYGLIRQESRFVSVARSGAGASGMMQVMPATAQWVARRLGIPHRPADINELGTNLRLGTHYLQHMLEQFDGNQALAMAGYNAGPGRPRRWRDGPELETAIWVECIPFGETRDYVKKVLSNASIYGGLLAGKPQALAPRLGGPIGPAR